MLDKLKGQIDEYKVEIVFGALIIGTLALAGYTGYKLGVKSAWPPKHLSVKLFEKGGKYYMRINGHVFENIATYSK